MILVIPLKGTPFSFYLPSLSLSIYKIAMSLVGNITSVLFDFVLRERLVNKTEYLLMPITLFLPITSL